MQKLKHYLTQPQTNAEAQVKATLAQSNAKATAKS